MMNVCLSCKYRVLEQFGDVRQFVCTKGILLDPNDYSCSAKVETEESKRIKASLSPVIDEIIQKSPHGGKLWKHRLKQKFAKQNETSQNEDLKINNDPLPDHPKQTYFNFEEEYTNE